MSNVQAALGIRGLGRRGKGWGGGGEQHTWDTMGGVEVGSEIGGGGAYMILTKATLSPARKAIALCLNATPGGLGTWSWCLHDLDASVAVVLNIT